MGLGLFRVILAFTVIITHTHPVFGFTLGNPVIAVRSFFIVSGFYMALILAEKYSSYRSYITNRFLRIYPIYLSVLFLTILSCLGAYFLRNNWGELDYYAAYISRLNIFSFASLVVTQIILFGRDILMFSGFDPSSGWFTFNLHGSNVVPTWPFLLVPQAWTLPLELLFYVLAPLLVRKKFYVLTLIFALSVFAKSLLVHLGYTSTLFTYRFFPTELCYFLLGIISYRIYALLKPTKWMRNIGFMAVIGMIALLCTFNYLPKIFSLDIFTVEWIYYGLITALLPFSFIYSKKLYLDRKIGELSYPVYISHILVNNIATPLFITQLVPNKNYAAIFVFLLCVLFSVLLLRFVQDPVEKFRRSIASKDSERKNAGMLNLSGKKFKRGISW